jgi:hypothetical protein
MNLSNITYNKFNKIYGIYTDKYTNENIFIIHGDNENSITLINLNKFLLKFTLNNLVTQEKSGLYYSINKESKYKNFKVSSFKLTAHNFSVKIFLSIKEYKIKIELEVLGTKRLLEPHNFSISNLDLKILIDSDNPKQIIQTTRGKTRKVYLLNNVVIKENDSNCDIRCEQLSNYVAMSKNINIVPFLGIINYQGKNLLVEKKMSPIKWEKCLLEINFYEEIKKKWKTLTNNIKVSGLMGDFNLGNILFDDDHNLIITDFNGSYKEFFLNTGMVLNEQTAYDLKLRLSDYYSELKIRSIFKLRLVFFLILLIPILLFLSHKLITKV